MPYSSLRIVTQMAERLTAPVGRLLALAIAVGIAGCGGPSEDPETLATRGKYMVAIEPPGAISLTKAAALVGVGSETSGSKSDAEAPAVSSVSSDDSNDAATPAANAAGEDAAVAPDAKPDDENTLVSKEASDITVVGRVHAGQLEPWEDGKASFMLSELPDDGHGEGHDSDNCPFCKRRLAKAPTAVVKFVDAQGQTLSIDSRKLFGLEKDQTVVVHGTVVAGEFNSIVLVADQLHIRK
jgi:hypothetical protein